jgi:hypothetical protein
MDETKHASGVGAEMWAELVQKHGEDNLFYFTKPETILFRRWRRAEYREYQTKLTTDRKNISVAHEQAWLDTVVYPDAARKGALLEKYPALPAKVVNELQLAAAGEDLEYAKKGVTP